MLFVYGDSHARSFKGVSFPKYKLNLNAISGASIKGLGRSFSHKQLSKQICNTLANYQTTHNILVLKFGQVDAEQGYLFTKFIKKTPLTFSEFTDTCFKSFEVFFRTVSKYIKPSDIIIWGINPPSPISVTKTAHFMRIEITLKQPGTHQDLEQDPGFLSELRYDKRLARAREFNRRLEQFAKSVGASYTEVFEELLNNEDVIDTCFEGDDFHIRGSNSASIGKPAHLGVQKAFRASLHRALDPEHVYNRV